jgi:hypothetical protein
MLKMLLAMRFEDSQRWRPGTPSYELPRLRRRTHVPPDPKLVTCLGVSSMLLSRWSPASLRLFGSDRPGRGCTGGSKARPGFLLPGRAFVCPDAPEGLVGTMGVSSSALVS